MSGSCQVLLSQWEIPCQTAGQIPLRLAEGFFSVQIFPALPVASLTAWHAFQFVNHGPARD